MTDSTQPCGSGIRPKPQSCPAPRRDGPDSTSYRGRTRRTLVRRVVPSGGPIRTAALGLRTQAGQTRFDRSGRCPDVGRGRVGGPVGSLAARVADGRRVEPEHSDLTAPAVRVRRAAYPSAESSLVATDDGA